MVISMLKIRRPLGRLIFNMGIAIPGRTVFLIETAPSKLLVSPSAQYYSRGRRKILASSRKVLVCSPPRQQRIRAFGCSSKSTRVLINTTPLLVNKPKVCSHRSVCSSVFVGVPSKYLCARQQSPPCVRQQTWWTMKIFSPRLAK